MKKPRVAICASNLTSPHLGGGESFVLGLATALAQRDDFRIGLVGCDDVFKATLGLDPKLDAIPIRRLSGMARVCRDALDLERHLRAWSPDLVHYPHEWCPRLPYRTLLTVQNIGWLHPNSSPEFGTRGRLLRLLARNTVRSATAVVAVSRLAASLWQQATGYALPIHVLAEGVDVSRRTPADLPPGRFVLAVSSSWKYKGGRLAAAVADELYERDPTLTTVIVGEDGPTTESRLYLGWRPHSEVVDAMARARVVLYLSRVESFGLPAFEALALGTPSIVLQETAMAEWLGASVRTVSEHPPTIASTVLDTLSNPPLRPLDNFDWINVAPQWADLYRRLLA